jgi:hypothetical protein
MNHPHTRAERRHARDVWRNRRRTHIFVFYSSWPSHRYNLEEAMQNGGWQKGGKKYFACGNRCMSAMLERYSDHQEVKALRRQKWDDWDDL